VAKVDALLKMNPNLVSSRDNTPFDKTPEALVIVDPSPRLIYGNAPIKQTPLHYSVQEGYKDIAELLLAHGAEVNAKNYKESTPLHNAASYGHKDMVELLLANKSVAFSSKAGAQGSDGIAAGQPS
jgi:ankyrin repeat protein